MRRILTVIVLLSLPAAAHAGEVTFSLGINDIPLTVRPDPRTEARLAQWNDPMGRLMHQFNAQQSWIMRGTMPGGDRVTGAAVKVKAQNGLPLQLLATSMQTSFNISERQIAVVSWPWGEKDAEPAMSLDEQLALLLGRRLVSSEEK